jgi:MoaA/NifB/PqqE/SkfB family radical SAM enzyme
MPTNWSILYRGTLSGCNYSCDYCPFAKKKDSRAVLERDAQELDKFVDWVETRKNERIGILFTPWGEGLIRKHYQTAITRLSQMPHVCKVSIQTNLSGGLHWLENCHKEKVALWTTYHPTQTTMAQFLKKCRQLDALQVKYSVGVVGFKEALTEIEIMRQQLPPNVYLWINALKKDAQYYTPDDIDRMTTVDPHIHYNLTNHISKGFLCRAGHTTFSVNGAGDVSRCHFIKTVIGNIYEADFEQNLYPRLCTNDTCGCHIGYVHLEKLHLEKVFGDGLLERIALVKQQ